MVIVCWGSIYIYIYIYTAYILSVAQILSARPTALRAHQVLSVMGLVCETNSTLRLFRVERFTRCHTMSVDVYIGFFRYTQASCSWPPTQSVCRMKISFICLCTFHSQRNKHAPDVVCGKWVDQIRELFKQSLNYFINTLSLLRL